MTVPGLAFVPMGIHNDYATGSWVTPEGYDGLSDGFKFHFGHVELQDGADAGAVGDRLSGELGLGFEPAQVPDEVAELRQVRSLPFFLAGFLALLGLGAPAHALAAAVRRRRHDLAALRALGLLRGQVRLIVLTQATIVGALGVVLGLPLGMAAGRTLWRYVADSTPVQYLPPAAVLALIVIPPATLLLANLLAALPCHRAVSMDLSRALRVE